MTKSIKGTLVILNGDCSRNLKDIYTTFIPTKDTQKALDYVAGNGDIIGYIPYEVDLNKLSDDEKFLILDRIANLN